MILPLYIYKCSACNRTFKLPGVSGENYGEFLLSSEINGELGYLNACDDKVFNEVSEIFDQILISLKINCKDKDETFQYIFGSACDPANDGSKFRIGLMPSCPYCQSRQMSSWKIIEPIEYSENDIHIISHDLWNSLDIKEKHLLIKSEILHSTNINI